MLTLTTGSVSIVVVSETSRLTVSSGTLSLAFCSKGVLAVLFLW